MKCSATLLFVQLRDKASVERVSLSVFVCCLYVCLSGCAAKRPWEEDMHDRERETGNFPGAFSSSKIPKWEIVIQIEPPTFGMQMSPRAESSNSHSGDLHLICRISPQSGLQPTMHSLGRTSRTIFPR